MPEQEKTTQEGVREEERTGQTSQMRRLRGYPGVVATVVAVAMSVAALLYITHFLERIGSFIPQMSYLSLMLAFILTLAFLLLPARSGLAKDKLPWYDVLIILIGIAGPMYNLFTWGVNSERYIYGNFYPFEIAFTFTTILAVLEATLRALGLAMPLVALAFLLHMFFGSALSGPFRTPPVRLSQIAHMMIYVDMGIYGVALQTAATVIIAFIIFSQFMFATGVGDFFIKFALALVGHVRGGPAKVAVIASSLLGTITGATTANIAGTGVFTIPMMKRIGYKPEFAGAVETVASNGGQIMPPIMGLMAFVMAEWLGHCPDLLPHSSSPPR
ncbi:MAG: TRAP transporter large permease subunit [Chloroflexota bacterium]